MLGEDLDGDGAVQAGVAGLVDLTHAARADEREDLVRAELYSCFQGHRSEPTISSSQVCSDYQRAQHRDKPTEAEPKGNVPPNTVWSLTNGEEQAE